MRWPYVGDKYKLFQPNQKKKKGKDNASISKFVYARARIESHASPSNNLKSCHNASDVPKKKKSGKRTYPNRVTRGLPDA